MKSGKCRAGRRRWAISAKTTIAHVRAGRHADPHLVQAVEKLAEAVAMLVSDSSERPPVKSSKQLKQLVVD
ncbi:MAG: hypothetical protein U1E60_22370 [Reyranellaceae bacterium]